MASSPQRGPKMIGSLVSRSLADEMARRGFAQGELVLQWGDLVGASMAALSKPLKLVWPRGKNSGTAGGGLLHIKADPSVALELAMLEPVLMARISTLFGWQAVSKLKIISGRVVPDELPAPRVAVQPSEALQARLSDVEDDALRAALLRLGAAVEGEKLLAKEITENSFQRL
jgi:hypothetical protein